MENGQQDAATGAPQDATPSAPTDTTSIPAQPQPATPESTTPTAASDTDEKVRQMQKQFDEQYGRVGADLDAARREASALRAQLAEQQAAPAYPADPAASYDDLLLSERPGAAFDQFQANYDSRVEAIVEEKAEQKAQAAVQGLRLEMAFEKLAPDLAGKQIAVQQAVQDLQHALPSMDTQAGLEAIARRARELLTANISSEAAPTPPPVASATLPTQAPQPPAGAVPGSVDIAAELAADRATKLARHLKATTGQGPIAPGGGNP